MKVVVVHGHHQYGSARVRAAEEISDLDVILFSGTIAECWNMRKTWTPRVGVGEWVDDDARTTFENVGNSSWICDKEGATKIVVVSSREHLPRLRHYWRFYQWPGVPVTYKAAPIAWGNIPHEIASWARILIGRLR